MKKLKNIAALFTSAVIISSCSNNQQSSVIQANQINSFTSDSSNSINKGINLNTKTVLTHNNKVSLLVDGSEIFPEIFNTIDSAQKKIYITTYLFGESIGHKIADKLIAKAKQGVQVEFVADGSMGTIPELVSQAKKEYKYMADNGVKPRVFPVDLLPKGPTFLSNQKLITHVKMVIADDSRIVVGGMNLKDSESINHDYMLKIEGAAAAELGRVGENDWEKSREMSTKAITDTNTNTVSVGKGTTDVEIAQTGFNDQSIPGMLINAINNATSSIKIEVLLLDHKEVIKALVNAKKRGVDVKVIIDQVDVGKYNKFLEKLPIQGMANFAGVMSLLDAGIEVKWYLPQQKDQMLHAKTMLIDNKTFITGSANFTFHALTRNHEVSVMVTEPDIANRYAQSFEKDWSSRSQTAKLTTAQKLIGKIFQKFDDYVYQMTEDQLNNELSRQLK